MSFCCAPGILIAMPGLADPNFHRSVVFICEHTEEGAFGLVLNRSLHIAMQTVCEETETVWKGPAEIQALKGGPVEPQRGWLLHDPNYGLDDSHVLTSEVALSASRDALEAYADNPKGRFRLMLGHAGWGAGQLDSEVATGSWLTGPADSTLIFHTPIDKIWENAMSLVGVNPAHLVEAGTQIN
jgi:putative transcriptional regulator